MMNHKQDSRGSGWTSRRFSRFLSILAVAVMAFSTITMSAEGNDRDISSQAYAEEYGIGPYTANADEPFVNWRSQINTDVSSLNSTNWMSGISGERYLNEINMPGSHDSVTKVLTDEAGYPAFKKFAHTQVRYIDEQLEDGIRWIDIRLSEKKGQSGDDGTNLYLCHGKTVMGAYFGLDHEGNITSVTKVFEWCTQFLKAHPTETIILDMTAEVNNQDRTVTVFNRLQNLLQPLSTTINPSTGEPYLYMQDGHFGKEISSIPQLKDCRGKIIVQCDDDEWRNVLGGFDFEALGLEKRSQSGGYKDDADDKIKNIRNFYNSDYTILPTDAYQHYDFFIQVGFNGTDELKLNTPLDVAEKVLKTLFWEDHIFDTAGRYYGYTKFDGSTEDINSTIWRANFFSGLEYRTVTIKSDIPGIPDQTYTLLRGTQINMPGCIYSAVQAEDFVGWQVSNGRTYKEGEPFYLHDNVTITAMWQYDVVFDVQGHGDAPRAQVVPRNGNATEPEAPTASGFVFGGWYSDAACKNKWNFGTAITKDITLYAKWTQSYTVAFDVQGHGSPMKSQSVLAGKKVTEPAPPTADGFIFDGWYKEPECANAWDFDTDTVTGNMTLYAKWIDAYTVQFLMQGHGTPVPTQSVLPGGKAIEPEPPKDTQALFDGWYTTTAYKTKWNFETDIVNSNVRLFAKWIDAFSVEFIMQGHGDAVPTQTIAKGQKAVEPDTPTEDGYIFGGWYTTASCTTKWNFKTDAVNSNMKLYAKWSEVVIVTFSMRGHGDVTPSQLIAKGDKAAEPDEPSQEGYLFAGWCSDAQCTKLWNFDTDKVSGNTVLYAKWLKICDIIFNTRGHGGESICLTTTEGCKLTEPEEPSEEGYIFGGWYTDLTFNVEWNFKTDIVRNSMALYAKWIVGKVTVMFDTRGLCTPPADQLLDTKSTVSVPEEPYVEGYVFGGWFKDADCTEEWNFVTDTVLRDTTIYAKWNLIPVEITFNGNGGSPASQKVMTDSNGMVTEFPEVSYGDRVFVGWYTQATGGEEVSESTVFRYATTVFAHWEVPATFDVVIVAGSNGTVTPPEEEHAYEVGTRISVDGNVLTIGNDVFTAVPDEGTEKVSYEFYRWYFNGSDVAPERVTGNMSIAVIFSAISNDITWDKEGNAVLDATDQGDSVIEVDRLAEFKSFTVKGSSYELFVEDASALVGKTATIYVKETENKSKVSGTAYNFVFRSGEQAYRGEMQVTLPYENIDGKNPMVYFVNGDKLEPMEISRTQDGSVTFKTDHNSVYLVTYEEEPQPAGGNSGLLIPIIAIVLVLVIVGQAAVFIRKTKSA